MSVTRAALGLHIEFALRVHYLDIAALLKVSKIRFARSLFFSLDIHVTKVDPYWIVISSYARYARTPLLKHWILSTRAPRCLNIESTLRNHSLDRAVILKLSGLPSTTRFSDQLKSCCNSIRQNNLNKWRTQSSFQRLFAIIFSLILPCYQKSLRSSLKEPLEQSAIQSTVYVCITCIFIAASFQASKIRFALLLASYCCDQNQSLFTRDII